MEEILEGIRFSRSEAKLLLEMLESAVQGAQTTSIRDKLLNMHMQVQSVMPAEDLADEDDVTASFD